MIYLDNAATTRMATEALEVMIPYLTGQFGNPSSAHSHGRKARLVVEAARQSVASQLMVEPQSIVFTSCGTEANNMAVLAALRDLRCQHIITSPLEHHAVLNTVMHYASQFKVPVTMVNNDSRGCIDLQHLRSILSGQKAKCFVTLMHANNELGNLLDIQAVAEICKNHGAVYHADCVQTIGHLPLDLTSLQVGMASGSGHKFHGPKGTGILYIHPALSIQPMIWGGGQEDLRRSGTENVAGIAGFAKALELAMEDIDADMRRVKNLKRYFSAALQEALPGLRFNGDPDHHLYTVLSVSLPSSGYSMSLLRELDNLGICVSGGSACSSQGPSHVMQALGRDAAESVTIRFSFSRYNSIDEIDVVIATLRELANAPYLPVSG